MSELLFFKFKPGERSLEWSFLDPDTQFLYKANSRAELVKLILQYRINNRLPPIENLEAVLDDYLCRLPCNSGKCKREVALNRGLAAVWKGGILLLKSLMYQTFATQEVAEARAKQCVKCPYNVFPDKTGFIKWSDKLAEKTVGSRKTSNNDNLGNCEVCSCPLRCSVWYMGEKKFTEEELEKLDEVKCWQLNLPRE